MSALTKERVLNSVWQMPGIHRKQIAARFGLHPNLVSDAARELIREKWLIERKPENASVGRTPIELYLNSGRAAVAVSYSSSTMTCGLINAAGEVLRSNEIAHAFKRPEEIIALAVRQIAKLQARFRGIIVGIAVADPGMIDYRKGEVIRSSSFPAWRNVAMAGLLQARIRLETAMLDTTHARAVAQYRTLPSCNRDADSMLYIDYSEGRIGMTLVTPHGIWRGSGLAGEVGHVVIDPKGAFCDCGARGCLESEAGARALVDKTTALLAGDVHSVLREKIFLKSKNNNVIETSRGARRPPSEKSRWAGRSAHGNCQRSDLTAADIFDAARSGDRFARTVIHDVLQNLGFSAAILVAMLHPRFIVTGAESEEAIGILTEEIRQAINSRVPAEIAATVEVIPGRPTTRLGLIGAGLMMFEKAIQDGPKENNKKVFEFRKR